MRSLRQVVWSIIGDASSTRNNQKTDLEEVVALPKKFPNAVGAIMDDFFHPPDAQGKISRYSPARVGEFRAALHAAKPHPLDLWVVMYSHDLSMDVRPHLRECDVVTFWTWKQQELRRLEENFARAEALTPGQRRLLGIYTFDFSDSTPMPLELMELQCELGLRWLKEGRIEGMIFLATCVFDVELEAVEWARRWIDRVGEQRV